ncbi:MAG: hypothetical protein NC907_00075 [Candidatus Omnitrophica bacterium]|nr:hypothetical protein [Candidatus Omnitrophota bacterium]
MKKIWLMIFCMMLVCAMAQAKVNVITKSIVVYPEKEAGKIARIVFNTNSKGGLLFVIRDSKGNIVKILSSVITEAGQSFIDWDGKDFSGSIVGEGEYSVSAVTGISWVLDEKFGIKGRIGIDKMEIKVTDPEKIIFKAPGEIKKIIIGETECYKADSLSIAGPNYVIKDGNIQINPTAGAKKDDIVKVEYYNPFYLENPWAIDIDQAGNLYVLYKWKTASMKYPATTLVKISPDGKKIFDDFGSDGKIGPFSGHANQVIVNEKEGRIYICATSSHGTGVFSLKTGAFLYEIGGWFGSGSSDPRTTAYPAGIAFDKTGTKIYIRGFSAYDRTKEKDQGFLYRANFLRHSGYAPLIDNYWGPSMELAQQPDCFYASSYYSDISKIKDTGNGFSELYYVYVSGSPIGISLDAKTNLLFASLRTVSGEIAVLHDTGFSLNELWRLKDNELGTTHVVKIIGEYLYVVEDGASPVGRTLEAMKKANVNPAGKNRISRYKLIFDQEKDMCKITVKK